MGIKFNKKLREKLAELEHKQWLSWVQYIIKQWSHILPMELKEHWAKNIKSYSELREEEKDKDRVWADKVIKLIKDSQTI